MFVRIRLDPVVGLCLLACASVHAQAPAPSNKTLGDMIEQAKRQQAQALNPTPTPKALAPSNKKTPSLDLDVSTPPKKEKPPMLWSLTGMNHHLVAEVIYNEQVHILRLNEGERVIGPWLIERYGVNGLYLVPAVNDGKNSKTSLFLPAPTLGTSLEKFDAALPTLAQVVPPNRQRANSSDLAVVQDISDILPAQLLDNTNNPAPPAAPNKPVPQAPK